MQLARVRGQPSQLCIDTSASSPDERSEIRDVTPQSRSSYAERQAQPSGVTSCGHLVQRPKEGRTRDVAIARSEGRSARLQRAMDARERALGSSGLRLLPEAVERLGILHQDAVARSLVGGPLDQEVEQERVVRLVVVGQARVRPVATPDQALRRRLDERLRDLGGLWVGRWADLAVRIGARDFHPGAALVDQLADDLVR
jgi:hypothetical protein